jgi:hypothetical protein
MATDTLSSAVTNEVVIGIHTAYLIQATLLAAFGFLVHYTELHRATAIWRTHAEFAAFFFGSLVVICIGAILACMPCISTKRRCGGQQNSDAEYSDDSDESSDEEVTFSQSSKGDEAMYTPYRVCARAGFYTQPLKLVLGAATWLLSLTPLIVVIVAVDDEWFVIPAMCAVATAQAVFLPMWVYANRVRVRVAQLASASSSSRTRSFTDGGQKPTRRRDMAIVGTSSVSALVTLFISLALAIVGAGAALTTTRVIDAAHVVTGATVFLFWLVFIQIDTSMVVAHFKASSSKGRRPSEMTMSPFIGLSFFIRLINGK